MKEKIMVIADKHDFDDLMQRLDLIYSALSEISEAIKEAKQELDAIEGDE
tara:strand:- start:146 stop:295 length:150 start_codon:yes stop_codon:yes gene_type:complete